MRHTQTEWLSCGRELWFQDQQTRKIPQRHFHYQCATWITTLRIFSIGSNIVSFGSVNHFNILQWINDISYIRLTYYDSCKNNQIFLLLFFILNTFHINLISKYIYCKKNKTANSKNMSKSLLKPKKWNSMRFHIHNQYNIFSSVYSSVWVSIHHNYISLFYKQFVIYIFCFFADYC